jgi:hypothetical protein
MLEEGSAQHANSMSDCVYGIAYRSVYMVSLRSMRIHIWDMWRSNIWCVYVAHVLTWSIGVSMQHT